MDLTLDSLLAQPYTRKLVAAAARDLVRTAGLPRADRPDLEQAFRTALVEQFPRYDPARGTLTTFVRLVTECTARSILRARQAAKRGATATERLHADPDAAAHARRRGVTRAGPEHLAGLRADLAPVVAALPASLRALADRLTGQSVSEAARDLGLPRSTVTSMVTKIRRRFQDAGLNNYWPGGSSISDGTA